MECLGFATRPGRSRWAEAFRYRPTRSVAALLVILASSAVRADGPPLPPFKRMVTGADAQRIEALSKTIDERERAGQFAEALIFSSEILEIRRRVQGDDHWQTRSARIAVESLARAAALSRENQTRLAAHIRTPDDSLKLSEQGRAAEAERVKRESLELIRSLFGEDHPHYAVAASRLADALSDQGKYAEAEAFYRKALEIRRRAHGEDHPRTAESSNDLGVDLNHQAKYVEAEPLLKKALEIERQAKGDDHADLAVIYFSLAENCQHRGKVAQAEPLYRRALEIRRREFGDAHRLTGDSYTGLGTNLYSQGKNAEAEALFLKALEICRRLFPEAHPSTAMSYNNLAVAKLALGKAVEAEPLCRKSLEIWRQVRGDEHPETASAYNNVGMVLVEQGRSAEAEPYYQRALAIRRRRLGENHPDTGTIYHNLGGILFAQGKYAEAESVVERAVSIWQRALGPDHPLTDVGREHLAVLLAEDGKHAEAEPLYRTVLAHNLKQRINGEDNLDTARIYNNLGRSLIFQEKHAEANESFQKALAIWRRLLGENHRHVSLGYFNLGYNLDAWGKHNEAEAFHRKSLAMRTSLLGADHPDTAWAALELATNLDAQGKTDEAESIGLAATKSYEAARLQIGFAGLDRSQFASERSPLPLLAAVLARRGRATGAWQRWEANLARGLFDDLETRRRRTLTSDERHLLEELMNKLNQLDNQVAVLASSAKLSDDQRKSLDDLKARREEQKGRLAQVESDLVKKYNVAAGGVYGLTSIQAQLAPDEALIGWLDPKSIPHPADPRGNHWACVVRQTGSPVWIRLAGNGPGQSWSRDDEQLPERVRRLLASVPADAQSPWRDPVATLARQRLDALEPALKARDGLPAVRRLIVLPSTALAGIPIEALQEALSDSTPRYLISYAPSGTMFAWLAEHRRGDRAQKRRLLALGDPVPSPTDSPVKPDSRTPTGARSAENEGDAVQRRSRGASFVRLPGSAREVEAIAALFDQKNVLLGSDASEQNLESLRARGELGQFTVIHLATHGRMDDAIPMNSRLFLSQDRLPDPTASPVLDQAVFDGVLTAGQVMSTWKLNADLVTLSACQSGLGRQSGGEGFLGFAQAFFLAGSQSLVLSLWEVDDRATSILMVRFYQNWLGRRPGLDKPMSKAEALRVAKAYVRCLTKDQLDGELSQLSRGAVRSLGNAPAATRPFEHPHYWAGFILVGDPA
jgi:CHAT domain-containing protein/tetratricopeptide (TPR) repeat protein